MSEGNHIDTLSLTSREMQPALRFWKDQYRLLGEPFTLVEQKAPAPMMGLGTYTFPPELAAEMLRVVKGSETGFMVTVAAFTALNLWRHSRKETVAFQIPRFERSGAAEPSLIVQQIDPGLTLKEYLKSFAQNFRESVAYPLLSPAQAFHDGSGGNELVAAEEAGAEIAGVSFRYRGFHNEPQSLWAAVNLILEKEDKQYTLTATYAEREFRLRSAWGNYFLKSLGMLMQGMFSPGQKLSEIVYVDEEERRHLLKIAKGPEPPAEAQDIVSVFERIAEEHATRIAIICSEITLTYAELNARANRIAHHLMRNWQLQPGDAVGLYLDRSAEAIVAILGILKAGGAYVPLTSGESAAELDFLIRDAGLKGIILHSESIAELPMQELPLFVFDLEEPVLETQDENPAAAISGETPAYILYTSGTTGTPKGVVVPHRAVVRLAAKPDYVSIRPEDVVLHAGALSFDASTFEIWAALLNGACCSVSAQAKPGPSELSDQLLRDQVSIAWFTSGWFNQLVDVAPGIFNSLSQIIVGGERLSKEHVFGLKSICPELKIINGYGPTENTTFSACHTIEQDIYLGKPVAGTGIYLLDPQGNLCPKGMIGEIALAGQGLALEYLNQPELTAQKFRNGLPALPGERLYLSGDLGRWSEEDLLEYHGRIDRQFKIRGYRVEPAEVEYLLMRFPHYKVKQVVVDAVKNKSGYLDLVAWYIPGEGFELESWVNSAFRMGRAHLRPAFFIPVNEIPLTPNGKINYQALPDPYAWKAEQTEERRAPRNELERLLLSIWQEELGIASIGIDDDFFKLGGHSLKAVRMVTSIAKRTGAPLALVDAFAYSTIEKLAQRVQELAEKPEEGKGIQLLPVQEYYPLSHAQKRLWLLSQMPEASIAYNMPSALWLRGKLDVAALKKAFHSLVERQEALRTVFVRVKDEPVQKILKDPGFRLQENDLRNEPDPQESAKVIASRDAYAPFDLETGPLLRASLLRTGAEEWLLLFNIHHIINDGWSTAILLREISACYKAFSAGLEPDLPELPFQYKEYAAWSNLQTEGAAGEAHRAYWKEVFRNGIPVTEVPADFPRPAVKSFRGDHFSFVFDADASGNLRRLSQENGSSVFAALTALVNMLLYRYTGKSEQLTGTVIAGRGLPELENLSGFFVNTLPVWAHTDASTTFSEAVRETAQLRRDDYARELYPFDQLVQDFSLGGDLSRNPFFNIMITVDEPEFGEELVAAGLEGIVADPLDAGFSFSKFDLQINFRNQPGKPISFTLNYNTELYRPEKIRRMGHHLLALAKSAGLEPERPLSELTLLADDEQSELQALAKPYPDSWKTDQTILTLFDEVVRNNPGGIASSFESRHLSYAALDHSSDAVAELLMGSGIKPGEPVVLLCRRGVEMLPAMLGILKAGAAYIPLDPDFPAERIEYVVENCGAAAVLKTRDVVFDLSPEHKYPRTSVVLNVPDEITTAKSKEKPLLPGVHPGDTAYVIYTSGSTGRPKGVMVSHANVVRLLKPDHPLFDFSSEDVWTLFHSFTFDFSVWEIFGALLFGGRLVIVDKDTAKDPARLLGMLAAEKVTVLNQTPGAFYRLADQFTGQKQAAPTLRYVIFGGEALNPARLKTWHEAHPSVKLVNMYGITETTVHVTYKLLEGSDFDSEVSRIGKAIPTLSAYVLDESLNLMPRGIPGELCVGGAGVSKGYAGNEEATNERFVRNPFESGGKIYRSGDVVLYDEQGELIYLGRSDQQVKIRGYRIEPAEVEKALKEISGIQNVYVAARRQSADDWMLCCWYKAESDLSASRLRDQLSGKIPEYMIPSWFIRVDEFPLTANGKIDREALFSLHSGMPAAPSPGREANPTEQKLQAVWKEILGLKEIPLNQSFFELGGHSLAAASLTVKIQQQLDASVPLKEIFLHPTVEGMAEVVHAFRGKSSLKIPKAEAAEWYPLSAAQRRLYIVSRFEGVGTSYNMPGAVVLQGDIDSLRIRNALISLVERHESLRTGFEILEGLPVQRIQPAEIMQAALTGDGYFFAVQDAPESEWKSITEDFVQPFDLSRPPLFRAKLLREAKGRALLLFDMHHIVSDGGSMSILIDEFFSLLAGEPLPRVELTYKDFAEWQHRMLDEGGLKTQSDFWKQKFSGEIPILNLPADYARPGLQNFEGDHYQFYFDKELTEALRALAAKQEATLFMTLLAMYFAFLSRYSGQSDILVGSPISGRSQEGLDRVVGMFVNMLAIRAYPEGGKTFSEFLAEVRKDCLEVYQNGDLPFEDLVDMLDIPRDISRNPLFDTCFLLNHENSRSYESSGLQAVSWNISNPVSKFDLTLAAHESREHISFTLEYCVKLFSRETIAGIAKHFTKLVREFVKVPSLKLSEADVLDEDEKDHLLREVNSARTDNPLHETIQQRFERMAVEHRDRIAVSLSGEALTYGELNAKANAAGARLRKLGVGPEKVVAVLSRRSIERIIGIAAAWKSGGAFLPLDPGYPKDRVKFMLEDSGAVAAIVHQGLEALLPEGFPFINLDEPGIFEGPAENLPHQSDVHQLCHLIYTSGSTGLPKGIQITQFNILRRIVHNNCITFFPEDKVLQMVNFTFDVSTHDIYGALLNGCELVMIPEGALLDMPLLTRIIREKQVSLMFAVTPVMNLLIDADVDCLRSVRLLQFGGEAASVQHCFKALKHLGPGVLCNAYGPAESTIYVSYHILNELQADAPNVPIGKVLSNTRIYILDAFDRIQPVGIAGELCIAGEGLARGYQNRPQLTAEKFVADPFVAGERTYRTGDLARWNHKGELEYLGRIDHQVKVRGFRIEPGEIEFQLTAYPGIDKALVIDRSDSGGARSLIAYFTAGHKVHAGDLKQFLGLKLPDYMVPSFFVQLDEFPLTSNGKIDRKALPQPGATHKEMKKNEMPSTETETLIHAWWQEILRLQDIGIHDNFFDLGGNSLNAVALMSRFDAQWPSVIRINDLFDYATVQRQAALVQERLGEKQEEAGPETTVKRVEW